ncbi:restriction endonuclease subunit S [Methylocapsa palsarum]|uniref:Type I restriction enzyme, S subunit n=1 Tax=Methylocapsa palsarum TaxID=1612308 RepID=A0A1I4BV06_9HYPH|nr:restriction endonuclease subunit S [Methylocapsa palsarum]SFK71899.1 type I restriction enzyme, S subunit [Methylocapsa palsarum]
MSRRDFLQEFVGTSLWATVPAKRRFRYEKTINFGMAERHRLALTMGGVVNRSLDDLEGLQSSDYSTYQIFEPGDLAFKLIDLQNIKTSRVGLVPRRGIMSPAYIRLRPMSDQTLSKFYYWYFYAAYLGNIFNGLGGGIRQNLSQTELLEFPVPDISREDQEAISTFLERETGRADTLIRRKRQFIDLLKERATGEIIAMMAPQNTWQAVPFWSITTAKCITGMATEGLLSVYLDRGVIPYSEGGGLVHKPAESLEKYQLVEPGDLVMNNQQAWRGSVGVSTHRGIVSPAYVVLGLDPAKIDPAFANYAFRSKPYVDQFMIASMSVGDIQRQIKWHLLRRIPVYLPPLEEQRAIAARLDREKARINGLIAKTERSIELLKEHRSALITAAVTGKIDVRGAAAKTIKAAA